MNSATENIRAVQIPCEFEVTVETSRRGYRLFAPLYDIIFCASLQHGRRLAIDVLDCHLGEMIAKAAQRVTQLGLEHTEALLQMDAEHMSFGDATFDKAVVLFGMAGLPDPVRAMNEIERVCRPGARIVIANHFQPRRPILRVCDGLLSPIYRLLRYRADLDMQVFVAAAGLDVIEARPANLFGDSTVLVCRKALAHLKKISAQKTGSQENRLF